MTKSSITDYSELDIHMLLIQRRQIAIIWSIEDVQEMRPDLNDDQAWKVLQQCGNQHDCNYGLTWEGIEAVAEILFPEPI